MNQDQVEIVIVEDDPTDALLLTRIFQKQRLANSIVLLKDGAAAMDFLLAPAPTGQEPKPRVVILDLKLPKVNGIEVLRRIKSEEQTRRIPVVVLTSSREDRDIRDAYAAGVNSYVTKPIKFDEFTKIATDLEMYWLLVNRKKSTMGAKLSSTTAVTVMAVSIRATFWLRLWLEPKTRLKK